MDFCACIPEFVCESAAKIPASGSVKNYPDSDSCSGTFGENIPDGVSGVVVTDQEVLKVDEVLCVLQGILDGGKSLVTVE